MVGSATVVILQPLCVMSIRDTFDQLFPSVILPANIQ